MLGKLKGAFGLQKKVIKIAAPLEGATIALSEVNDPVFNEEMFGRGIAIKPITGHVVSPINGIITQMFDTSHAVSLTSDEGAEILIHIGLDTVRLNGEHFTTFVKNGDSVKIGDKLIDFNLEAIAAAGYDIVTPVVICNSNNYKQFDIKTNISVKIGDEIISLGE